MSKDEKEPKVKKKIGLKGGLLLTVACLLGVMFIPVALILIVGMAPTYAAAMVDKSPEKLRAVTVGFMNFAGCYPFLLTLVITHGNSPEAAISMIAQPVNIVIMLMAAGCGVLIEIFVSKIVAGFLVQSAENRIKDISNEQKDMVKRWGQEVSGDIPLDAYGFPLKQEEGEQDDNKDGASPAQAGANAAS